MIYLNDHRPSHVHVIGRNCEAVFQLNCPSGPAILRENYGFSHKFVVKIADGLASNHFKLCNEWRRIHGDF